MVAGKSPVPVRFCMAGLWFRLLANNREPGPWNGLLGVTRKSAGCKALFDGVLEC
jgi:hypothetical protein